MSWNWLAISQVISEWMSKNIVQNCEMCYCYTDQEMDWHFIKVYGIKQIYTNSSASHIFWAKVKSS